MKFLKKKNKLSNSLLSNHTAIIYWLKFNNRNTRDVCEICSGVKYVLIDVVLVFLLLTLNIFHTFF